MFIYYFLDRDAIIIDILKHSDQLGVIIVPLYLKVFFKLILVITRISSYPDDIFISEEFKKINLVQIPCSIEAVCSKSSFIELFNLGI